MTLEDFLSKEKPPVGNEVTLSHEDLVKFFWKYKGLLKDRERNSKFWESTNESLELAYKELNEQEKAIEQAYSIIQEDLEIASKIQKSLMPNEYNKLKEKLDIAIYHKQLAKVGGDYYDFFKNKDNNYAIGLFDISGHGVSAALIMAYLKAQFVQAIQVFISPKEIVEYVNKMSYKFLKQVKRYATINFVIFYKDLIRYTCGGGYGFIINKNELLEFKRIDNFLGIRKDDFREFSLPFKSGDLLILFTDGIVEALNFKEDNYSVNRIKDLIFNNKNKDVHEIINICLKDYREFTKEDYDDITLIIIKNKD